MIFSKEQPVMPHPSMANEHKTITAMISLYCRERHRTARGKLCPSCADLLAYAQSRLEKCPFAADKPTCSACPVHCYKPGHRERVREKRREGGVGRPIPPQKGPQKLRRFRILRREADDRRARDADPHRKLHVHAEERQDQDRRSGKHRHPAKGKTPRKQRLDIDGALLILPDERSGRRVDSAREKKGDQRRRDHVADVRVYVRIRQLRDE